MIAIIAIILIMITDIGIKYKFKIFVFNFFVIVRYILLINFINCEEMIIDNKINIKPIIFNSISINLSNFKNTLENPKIDIPIDVYNPIFLIVV